MSMTPRNQTALDMIEAAKKMPTSPVDNAGNPINSLAVAAALQPPSGGKKGTK